jgi:hypothetical protein
LGPAPVYRPTLAAGPGGDLFSLMQDWYQEQQRRPTLAETRRRRRAA